MSSKSRSNYAKLEEASRGIAGPMRAWLSDICANPAQHARFLNTLSLMEHIGSRKIMASQSGAMLQQETLKHLAEETRHAFFFKRAAETMAGQSLDYGTTNIIVGPAARMYMARLDAYIENALSNVPREAAYLYMSLVVEFRAVWFYRLYQDVLTTKHISLSLKSVLAEEELHLDEMTSRLASLDAMHDTRTEEFCAFECGRFATLWNSLSSEHSQRVIHANA